MKKVNWTLYSNSNTTRGPGEKVGGSQQQKQQLHEEHKGKEQEKEREKKEGVMNTNIWVTKVDPTVVEHGGAITSLFTLYPHTR